jgi:hypothetical protein
VSWRWQKWLPDIPRSVSLQSSCKFTPATHAGQCAEYRLS